MAKEILIPQTSFTAYSVGQRYYLFEFSDVSFKNEKISVIFDGNLYICSRLYLEVDADGYLCAYGAPYNSGIPNYDFTEYPFNIEPDGRNNLVAVAVGDTNQHTIEIYTGNDVIKTAPCKKANVFTRDTAIFYFNENTGDFLYFDGDRWNKNNDAWGKGIVTPKQRVAVVGTAIVGLDVVGQALVNTALVDSAIVDTDITG